MTEIIEEKLLDSFSLDSLSLEGSLIPKDIPEIQIVDNKKLFLTLTKFNQKTNYFYWKGIQQADPIAVELFNLMCPHDILLQLYPKTKSFFYRALFIYFGPKDPLMGIICIFWFLEKMQLFSENGQHLDLSVNYKFPYEEFYNAVLDEINPEPSSTELKPLIEKQIVLTEDASYFEKYYVGDRKATQKPDGYITLIFKSQEVQFPIVSLKMNKIDKKTD